jgi:hypothetical protein
MTDEEIKILRAIVGEGYKLKAQHNNPGWRDALENAEQLLINERKRVKEDQPYLDRL